VISYERRGIDVFVIKVMQVVGDEDDEADDLIIDEVEK
jgi:hypothetical protein